MNETKQESEALELVLTDIIHSEDERAQNNAIDRYVKLNLAIGLRHGNIDMNAITKDSAIMGGKRKE